MTKKVFIPHVTTRWCETSHKKVPAFDLSPAAAHGMLMPILEPDDNPSYLARITPKIVSALEEFNEGDFLLAVGDPSVIAVCAGVILRKHNNMNLLKWDRKLGIYIALEIKL